VRLEGLGQLKNPMTLSGIEPALLYEIASVLTVNYDDPCDTVQ
jgi:hypothetical protein